MISSIRPCSLQPKLHVDLLYKIAKLKSNTSLFFLNIGTLQCDYRPCYSCSVTRQMNASDAGGDLGLVQTSQSLLLSLNANYFQSASIRTTDLHNKSSEVCIKTRSPAVSLPFKGQVTDGQLQNCLFLPRPLKKILGKWAYSLSVKNRRKIITNL